MYRISVAASLLVALYLDSFLFARFHLFGIRPDCLLALLVSLGVLLGQSDGLILGLVAGLLSDVLFGRAIGLGAVAYMLAGVAGGFFIKVLCGQYRDPCRYRCCLRIWKGAFNGRIGTALRRDV